MELQMLVSCAVRNGFFEILRQVAEIDFVYAVLRALQKPDVILAECQNIEYTVCGLNGQKWFDMKAFGYNRQFFKSQRQPEEAKFFG